MDYLWLKALHIFAVVIWVGGLLVVAVSITGVCGSRYEQGVAGRVALLSSVRRWDGRVTTPALLVVWLLGLALAQRGHWFPQAWLVAKLTMVLLLSALHGILSGKLRRLSLTQETQAPGIPRHAAEAVVGAVFIIVVLVVIKPIW